MDETVYQCPECNFNADNISELDSHLVEFHSNELSHNNSGNRSHHLNGSNDNLRHRAHNNHSHHDEEDDEDFFNEKNGVCTLKFKVTILKRIDPIFFF
jgi:hypothetical protein